jgi:Phage integrase family
VRIRAAFAERSTGELVLGPPKSRAGRRIVGIPRAIIPALREHLSVFVAADPGALVFPGPKGGPLRQGKFNRQASWPHAARAIGAEGLHFHDLRHTGNAWAAGSGVGLRDLMARMGHDSVPRSSTSTKHAAPMPPSPMRSTPMWSPSRARETTTVAPLWSSYPRANGTSMARGPLRGLGGPEARDQRELLTWGFVVERVTERVTGIEPALSAWESHRSGSLTALTWASDAPLVTVTDPVTPGLMAPQWPTS